MSNINRLNQIQLFLAREKFVASDWRTRGLTPPDGSLRIELVNRLNVCARDLVTAVRSNLSKGEMRFLLKRGLEAFNKLPLDTETKEIIAEYFYTLASLVDVDCADDVSVWLYGTDITAIRINEPEAIDTLEQKCSGCGTVLKSFITDKRRGIPALWLIVKCTSCLKQMVLSLPTNVKTLNVENYVIVEQLRKDEYTAEEANSRVSRNL